jgi:uncharacterized PurR-regulated membrane protein YhhQ (DUF165 family)
MTALLYIMGIIAANVITAALQPIIWGAFIVPWGTFFIGATFILRDLAQIRYGRTKTYGLITVALALSALLSRVNGDSLAIIWASAVSFLLSETLDTEIFTRTTGSLFKRISLSGTLGGIVDSGVFVVLGLSPIGAGFLPWGAVLYAIAGQVIVKTIMQLLGASVYDRILLRRNR